MWKGQSKPLLGKGGIPLPEKNRLGHADQEVRRGGEWCSGCLFRSAGLVGECCRSIGGIVGDFTTVRGAAPRSCVRSERPKRRGCEKKKQSEDSGDFLVKRVGE